jgi:hypothetical protein
MTTASKFTLDMAAAVLPNASIHITMLRSSRPNIVFNWPTFPKASYYKYKGDIKIRTINNSTGASRLSCTSAIHCRCVTVVVIPALAQ